MADASTSTRNKAGRTNPVSTDAYPHPLSLEDGSLCRHCDEVLGNKCPGDCDYGGYGGFGACDSRAIENVCYDITEIQKSAQACGFCAILWDIFQWPDCRVPRVKPEHVDRISIDQEGSHQPMIVTVEAVMKNIGSSSENQRIKLGTLNCCSVYDIKDTKLGKLPSKSDDDSIWRAISAWISDCQNNHVNCRNPSAGDWKPTRLLDLEIPGLPDHIRLCEKNEIPSNPKYVTLSHCWGSIRPKVHDSQTSAWLRQPFLSKELPNTFQDAIATARQLGTKYLWIDSLCIIQDCKEDWKREAIQMSSVYGRSFCNIAASAAEDSTRGFLGSRDVDHGQPVCVDLAIRGKWNYNTHCIFARTQSLWESFLNAPLLQRAWVFQERVLAPRVIHFGLSQVFWECNEVLLCERFPGVSHGFRHKNWPTLGFKRLNSLKQRSGPERSKWGNNPPDVIGETWKEFVRVYSEAGLTVKTDRVMAMKAIMEKFEFLENDECTFGLWKSKIAEQLFWHGEDGKGSRPRQYVAPSWSWISLFNTPISTPVHLKYDQISLLDIVDVNVPNLSELGKSVNAEDGIRVRCSLVKVVFPQRGGKQNLTLLPREHRPTHISCDEVILDSGELPRSPDVFCLPAMVTEYGSLHCLLLEPIKEDSCHFQRLGMFSISSDGYSMKIVFDSCEEYGSSQTDVELYDGIWKIYLVGSPDLETEIDYVPSDLESSDGILEGSPALETEIDHVKPDHESSIEMLEGKHDEYEEVSSQSSSPKLRDSSKMPGESHYEEEEESDRTSVNSERLRQEALELLIHGHDIRDYEEAHRSRVLARLESQGQTVPDIFGDEVWGFRHIYRKFKNVPQFDIIIE